MNKIAACAATALLCAAACRTPPARAAQTPAPITFATLDAHTQIQVDYESQGCYHHFRYHLTFRRSPVLQMADTDMLPAHTVITPSTTLNDVVNARRVWQSKSVGVLSLPSERAMQLDNLLAFYRYNSLHPALMSTTTYDTITYAFVRDGKTVQRETFKDSSGLPDASVYEMSVMSSRMSADARQKLANLTTFGQLHAELAAQTEAAAKTKNIKAGR